MRTTKKTLIQRLEYLQNVTGQKFTLSAQCSGNGRGYSYIDGMGRHAMTCGHVPAAMLDACASAFVKGFYGGEENEKLRTLAKK
jgi:hypothetical protein